MNVSPNVNLEKIEEADIKLPFQFSKCLNRWESHGDHLGELAGYISASDMCSLSVSPDKCAILQETVNQIRQIKLEETSSSDELQKSEVSSSKPNFFRSDSVGPLLLQALDGFLFMVNTDGKIEFVTTNVKSFLKYSQENLIDKSIYNIIHVGDHARFSSNLLPMSIGNGFGWSEPEASVGKSSFNCRFLIKPPEDQEETMEEKQTRVSQYENMQISAVLLPYGREKNENLDTDVQNHLVCVARRLPQNEKNNLTGTEQFQTRLDLRGKILSIDTSGVSAAYSQYLNKDLVGRRIQDFCHHEDFLKLNQHLKETLQQGSSTSGIYRLRLAHEKIVYVQSKSKRYSHMASEQEMIIANYTLIRDSEHCLENNVVVSQRNNPSPASSNLVPNLGNTMNGNSYPFSALSPQEFNLNDIGLDFLPSSSWDLGGGEEPTPSETLVGPSASRTASAFSPDLRSPAQVSATNSPAPGRVTPFSNTFPFSPQTASRTASPASRRDEGAELSTLSPMGGLAGDSASMNQKLRNLLTHGVEEADSSVPQSASDKMEEGEVENGYVSRDNMDVASRSDNVILRELLNQEDEDVGDENRKGLPCDSNCNVNANDLCSSETLQKGTVNSNNMLRKVSADSNMTHRPKTGTSSNLSNEVMSSVVKRKSPDTPTEDSMAKRQVPQNPQQAHLAGQNPMLASMLAQTPRTAPSVPTSIANAIVSQLPQERLPKNLEKKLVHTPYTSAPTASSSSGPFGYGQVGTRSLLSTSLQQEVVTADTRGHVTLATSHGGSSFQGGFLHKMVPQGESTSGGPYGAGFSRSSQQQNLASHSLFDGMVDINSDANMGNTSDPLLSDILDQVWSMEQDMNLDSTSSDDIALFKLLEEIPETAPATSPRPPSAHDVNEKMAIHAIQRQLMSFEIPRGSPRFQQQQQQQMPPQSYPQANPYQAPPAYVASNPMQRTRAPVLQGGMVSSAPPMMQMGGQRQAGPQYTSVNDLTPQMRRQIMERRQQLFMVQQQKRLLLQQQKQQLSLSTRPAMHDNLPNSQSPSAGAFAENINELMNNTVAPNVSLQRSASMPEPQLSPRYSGVPSPSQQLSPPSQRPSFSPQPYYPPSRLSPHSTPAWVQQQQRVQQNPANLQQQNPMLNAQLSQQQASFAARFSTQQQAPRQVVVRSLPSPGSRNSPYSNPPDSPFHPPSPGVSLYQQQTAPQQQQQQQRMQRAVSIPNRVNSPRGMSFGEPLLSPQPSPGNYGGSGPGFNPSGYGSEGFSFEQQVYQPTMVDRNRSSGGSAMTSEYVRQELRAMVGARTQQHQVHQQQLVQPMSQASGSQSTNQSLSQADFEALGFSLDLPNDGPPSSPALFPQSLMGSENQPRTGSPRFQLEEQRPTEQKKSLLQQLLSEPP